MNKTIYKPFLSLLLALLLVIGCSVTAFAAETDSDKMRLNTPDESGNTAFAVENMFPGDAETKDFTVKVNHKEPITLYYHADIRPGYEKLAEVMMVKIELPEKSITLYDGLMRDMPSALEHQLAANEKEVIYRITAYLDTSVGNDYQFKNLIADFRWWYEEETSGGGEDPDPDKPSSAPVKFAAEKILDGQYPRGSEFSFVLTDEDGKTVQTIKNRDGLIEFDTIRFNKAGTYTYYIKEQVGSDDDIRYDTAVYKAIVTVTEEADAYAATVVYEKGGETYQVLPRFVNKTKEDDSGDDPGTTDPTDPTDPTEPSLPEVPDNPKTGDDSNITLYMTMMLGSLAALIFLLLLMKRKKEEEAHE